LILIAIEISDLNRTDLNRPTLLLLLQSIDQSNK